MSEEETRPGAPSATGALADRGGTVDARPATQFDGLQSDIVVVDGKVAPPAITEGNRSHLADELRRLGDERLRVMRIPTVALAMVEVVVVLCHTLMDERDDRPWMERLSALFADVDPGEAVVALESAAEFSEDQMQEVIDHIARPATRQFYRKLLGAAAYDRLAQAVTEDTEAVLRAIQRGLVLLQPMAVAVQDSVRILSDRQLQETGLVEVLRSPILRLMLEMDQAITHALDAIRSGELARLSQLEGIEKQVGPEELSTLADQLRQLVEQDLQHRVATINEALNRKIQGARSALAVSEDGPSQAANSLVELIDRLLREGVTDAEVLYWVDTGYPGSKASLTYDKNGEVAPTKRAEALYFAYGRSPATAVEPLRETSVAAILAARSALQGVKHADDDPQAARELVEESMRAVQGAMGMAFRFAALTLGDRELEGPVSVVGIEVEKAHR